MREKPSTTSTVEKTMNPPFPTEPGRGANCRPRTRSFILIASHREYLTDENGENVRPSLEPR
jgi:hypothetical protein